jgi:DNA-binding response OmpR family regulator
VRILIVEDERDFAFALKSGLEQQGFAVDVVFDGNDGLAMTQSYPYDLILLDRMLPGKDGVGVCRELRARGISTPVVMMTALDGVDDRVEGLDGGADDYLVKPFEVKELMARVRARLRRTAPLRSNMLLVFDLMLDLETGDVRRAGSVVTLSRKEFTLLAHLMREPGRVFTKEQLLDHVWDADAEPDSDVVRAQVKNLRKKVDDPFERKLIKTVYGMGYKIEA